MATLDEALDNEGGKRRRSHKKSKRGCGDCRRRRVKCSEEKPRCQACVRRGVQCQYPTKAQCPSVGLSPSSTRSAETSPGSSLIQPASEEFSISNNANFPSITDPALLEFSSPDLRSTTFGIHDMALLHHWTVSTSLAMYQNSNIFICWQIVVPQLAFSHAFVMQAMLSLAALHLAYLNRPDKTTHMTDAAHHHTQGLHGFHEALGSMNSGNSDALFIWSVLNIIYVFSISGRLGDKIESVSGHISRKDRILGVEWIPMMRGIDAVLQPTYKDVKSGPLSRFLCLGNWDQLDPDKSPDADDEHFCRIRSTWERGVDAQTYDETLQLLRKCRLFIRQFEKLDGEAPTEWGFNSTWAGPFTFVHFAPQEYLTLLQQRQPPALILFAFFGALIHAMNDCWFMDGWGQDIVEAIDDLLGRYWKPWISWPVRVVGL
ncbi:hypothetical protein BGZ61DRAFT_362619 [Ilyonectria robusta]|uniref:uncharacterized protein n=1 Tax=Ilyonectria robusta TaxID=1079257 RepID=UPI001E8E6CD9|nr:uncharacterized protein BGZ61DRAFT_362619 [Ilyonectria robusta]KAH8672304.1 hypothetical protein BGZ61DRAFT_362619 [Ilyonectria robusta]